MAELQAMQTTPLNAWHLAHGARMVEFAGWQMPIQYQGPGGGIVAEHLHTRAQASLFDVSHMGQMLLTGAGADAVLESLLPGDIVNLPVWRMRYSLLTLANGGILDDLMVLRLPAANPQESCLHLVVNAARRMVDEAHLRAHLPAHLRLEGEADQALLALQGPAAEAVLGRLLGDSTLAALPFMGAARLVIGGIACLLTRSGYTGEDGFELSCAASDAVTLADLLVAQPEVRPAGLGARDSLRLEAGLCLYGHDITEQTTPIEADLAWTLAKRHRLTPDAAIPAVGSSFLGAEVVLAQLAGGVSRQRIGLSLAVGSPPAREGAVIQDADTSQDVGVVTSGGFSPSLQRSIAMGMVDTTATGDLQVVVRGQPYAASRTPLPFVPTRYKRLAGR